MAERRYDRAAEDVGNIVEIGHVNFRVPDQGLATTFYITGLGLTRDPYMMTGTTNIWVNVGKSQFHLPTGPAVVAPGIVTGLVVPDLGALAARLEKVRKDLAGTGFDLRQADGVVEAICPWGNRIRCHAPDEARFGPVRLGMAYVDMEVPRGRAEPIARFYRDVMGAMATVEQGPGGAVARIASGPGQSLLFREMAEPAPACPEHHVQIYLADFAGPYRKLADAGIEVADSSQHQYRFTELRDASTREKLFVLDHEVRSMTHPMYGRDLVNRDAAQTTAGYRAGHDQFVWRI